MRSGGDLGKGLLLARRQFEGQGGDHPRRQFTGQPAGFAARPHKARTHQLQGQLSGQVLVIGEPAAGRAGSIAVVWRFRGVNGAHRIGKTGPAIHVAPRRAGPFGQVGQSGDGLPHQFGQRLGRKSVRQRIDRFDQGQSVAFVRFDDVVGMGDLLFAVEKADLARDDAPFPDRQRFFHPAAFGAEKDQLHLAGLVMGEDAVRHPRAPPGRGLVAVDMQVQRDDVAEIGFGDWHLFAPVDGRRGHVHQQIDDQRVLPFGLPKKPRQKRRQARPDALEGRHRTEQRIEQGGTRQVRLRLPVGKRA